MTRILNRLPLLPRQETVSFGKQDERTVVFSRDSLLVWLSVGLRGEDDPRRLSPPFPAVLDSGNTCEAYLHEHHLVHWAGIRPALLAVLTSKRINEVPVPFREADV